MFMDTDLANSLDSIVATGYEGDICLRKKTILSATLMNDKIVSSTTTNRRGIGIRVIGKQFVNYGEAEFQHLNIEEFTKRILELPQVDRQEIVGFPPRKIETYQNLVLYNQTLDVVNMTDLVNIGLEIHKMIRRLSSQISCSSQVKFVSNYLQLANTNGAVSDYHNKKIIISLSVRKDLNGTTYAAISDDIVIRDLGNKHIVKNIKNRLIKPLLVCDSLISRSYEKIGLIAFMPLAFSKLLGLFTCFWNGSSIKKLASPLIRKQNKTISNVPISIFDDPTINFRNYSYPFDADGIKARKTRLVNEGIQNNFIHNIESGGDPTKSTGNSWRYFIEPPIVEVSNLCFCCNDDTIKFSLSDIDECCIVIYDFMIISFENVINGKFNIKINCGGLIKRGKFVGIIENWVLSGNIFDIFDNLIGIGSQLYQYDHVLTPAIYFNANVVNIN